MGSYTVQNYGEMMTDPRRMDAYDRAIRAACRPGSVVLDLGAGTGIMALLACRAGAARVYAIETCDAIAVAREIAQANGVADRITFIHGRSTDISLPESVDLIVADLRGTLPIRGASLASMIDARRFLAADGVIIPAADVVRGALVEAPASYDTIVAPWRQHARGFDTSAAERLVLQSWRKQHLTAEALLTAPHDFVRLDYHALETTSAGKTVTVRVVRPGSAHGLAVWFDTTLFGDIGFSNEPGVPVSVYGQGFFALPSPVPVDAGDVVQMTLRATPVTDDYVWCWDTRISSASGTVKAQSSQSTFHEHPLSARRIRALDAEARPSLSDSAAVDRLILQCLDGETTVSAVADAVRRQFPDRFADERVALARVRTVLARYPAEAER
jgi:type I protein arginine methyltransferase